MEKKYQVFVSSTYTDLIEERHNITNVLLMADCIPAGMEAFVASDDEQFNIIKRVIDLCDYYILIIGERYGSINEKTDKSYTEMEFEYAVSKDIPILVFAKDIDLDSNTTEEDIDRRAKLHSFRKRALTGRLGGIWSSLDELTGQVAVSIMKAKIEKKRPGWVRNMGFDPEAVADELNLLRTKIVELEKENKELKENGRVVEEKSERIDLSQYKIQLHFTEKQYIWTSNTPPPHEMDIDTDLQELFKYISVRISGRMNDEEFIKELSSFKTGYYVNTQQALIIKSQLIALGMLEEVEDEESAYIKLSPKGKEVKQSLNAPICGSQENRY